MINKKRKNVEDIKRWRRAGGPRRAECAVGLAGEFAYAALTSRILFFPPMCYIVNIEAQMV
jgi:hypothetical protein